MELLFHSGNAWSKDREGRIAVQDTPEAKQTVSAWVAILQHRAKPSGLFRKVDRNIIDVLTLIANASRGGDILAPYTNRLVSDFDRIKKFNNPQGNSSGYVMVQYALIRGDLRAVLNEAVVTIGPKELGDIFYEDSVMRTAPCYDDLLKLCEMTEQIEWPFVIYERSAVLQSASPSRSNAIDADGSHTVHFQRAPSIELNPSKPGESNAHIRHHNALKATALMRRAVMALSAYFAEGLKKLGASPSREDIRGLLDENRQKGIGLIARECICPALLSVMTAGYRSSHLLVARHPWDVVVALAEKLRSSARDLGGVSIPDAVDMVLNISDPEGRNRTVLARLSAEGTKNARVRMFLTHLLNQGLISAFFECLFDESTPVSKEFLSKYYVPERSIMVPRDSETAQEVHRLLSKLSCLNFSLCVDAEIW
jgi:hypothetical protein